MKYLPILTLLWSLAVSTITAQTPYAVETDPKTGKKGLVDPYDGRIMLPFEYDNILPLTGDSLIIVSKDRKMGALDLQGRPVVPLKYLLWAASVPVLNMPQHPKCGREKTSGA